MDATTSQLLINAAEIIIGLVVLQVFLKAWDKRAKAKEAKQVTAQKPVAGKKKK